MLGRLPGGSIRLELLWFQLRLSCSGASNLPEDSGRSTSSGHGRGGFSFGRRRRNLNLTKRHRHGMHLGLGHHLNLHPDTKPQHGTVGETTPPASQPKMNLGPASRAGHQHSESPAKRSTWTTTRHHWPRRGPQTGRRGYQDTATSSASPSRPQHNWRDHTTARQHKTNLRLASRAGQQHSGSPDNRWTWTPTRHH